MRMAVAGLEVPPAFVLPTGWCARPAASRAADLRVTLAAGIACIEAATDLGFGAARHPLLVSVRSGGAVSMPGMMETVLDVGMNDQTVDGLIRLTGNPRLAWDSYRRLIQGYAGIVAGLPDAPFDALVGAALAASGTGSERDLDFRALRGLTRDMLDCYAALAGTPFPADPHDQLEGAAGGVFRSWDSPKALLYREMHHIPAAAGTAVTVQTMIYGNAGGQSGAGVAFTRDPATGARKLYFDFQFNAQGEDVVGGRHRMGEEERLRRALPKVWARLEEVGQMLETLFADSQDFEFTVQAGRLYLLQTRTAERTPWAAIVMAVDMVEEGLVTPAEALSRLAGLDLESVTRTSFAPPVPKPLAVAQVASLGGSSGAVALDPEAVRRLTAAGTRAILVRRETVTSDIEGIALASGILTATGGRTSHAAVVARQLGKVCLVACPGLVIDPELRTCTIGGVVLAEGDDIALNGDTGEVYAGNLAVLTEHPVAALATIAAWQRDATAFAIP
jgi:pyruvate,orthophosphate dikinase